VRVKLCFLVNVRKARGRRVAGGSNIGSTLGFEIGAAVKGRMGCTGVANAGDEEGIELSGAGVGGGRNIGAARGTSGWLGRLMLATRQDKEVQAQLSLQIRPGAYRISSETRRDRDYILARSEPLSQSKRGTNLPSSSMLGVEM
jgi:hypothetical protein